MIGKNFEFITDRDDISHLPYAIKEEVKRRGLYTSNNNKNISFCGMMIANNKIYMFIPKGSDYSKLKEIEFACLLMSMLERYASQGKAHIITDDEDNIEIGLCYLTLAKELLKDYQSYGLYTKISKKELINAGRINWKRTFQKQKPIFLKSSSPFFLEYYGYKYANSYSHEVSKIHAEIIRFLDYSLSWWLTKKNGLIAPDLNSINTSSLSKDEKKHILNKELNQAYSDREIKLLKNLITFLDLTPGTASTVIVLGIKKFEQTWENMLHIVLRGTKKTNSEWLPVPVYKSATQHLSDVKRVGMKPDIFIEDKNLLTGVVIDAKYYDAKNNFKESLPALSDILKQICYLHAVRLIHQNLTKIDNVFIFPGNHNSYSHIEFNHKQLTQIEISKMFPNIKCIYLNPVDVINAYVNNYYLDGVRTKLLSIN